MSASLTKITVETTTPGANAEWAVDMTPLEMDQQLLYNNLAYTLVAAVTAKLGVEFSKFLLDNDKSRLEKEVEAALKAVQPGMV